MSGSDSATTVTFTNFADGATDVRKYGLKPSMPIGILDSNGAHFSHYNYTSAVSSTTATVAAAGQMTTLDANYAYSSADAIRLTIATGAINAKVRVWACVISLDGGATKADTDSQTSTFA